MARDPIAVIPAAGVGTRLRPHTHTMPKVLLHVAGKPMIAHILDDLPALGIHEAVLIVGYLGELVQEYVTRAYPGLEVHFVDQPERLGLGHAVGLAGPYAIDRPVLVILGDTIFEADLASVMKSRVNRIGVKAVDDPRRFGIVELDAQGRVTRMVEKPEHPTSNLAITGIYFFSDCAPLFGAIQEIQQKNIRTKGEYQLTDAMQKMIEHGAEFTTFPVEGWYDCGKTETLLETNRVLLDKWGNGRAIAGSVVIPPVLVAPDAVIEQCIIGPHASIAGGARLKNAGVRDSIINEHAVVENILVEGSVVGESAVVRGAWKSVNVGHSSEVDIG
jgi:glucose-1-phosphate thymidylyltransferase